MKRLALLLLAIPLVAACGSSSAATSSKNVTLNLAAYSTPKPVLVQLIKQWTGTVAGRGVDFAQSYASSGSQARAVAAGLPCDIAFLSTGLDINTLAGAGLVSQNWSSTLAHGGIAADSVVAFAVRPGNPKHIHSWADLVQPGVKVVSPDPFSSGSAKWNVLAAYGQARTNGATDEQARAYVQKLFGNVVSQDASGSDAMAAFLAGRGDVLITYESEAYAAQASGAKLSIVVPPQTMLIELPMVATSSAPPQAKAFISYVHSAPAQTIFAENGYRPVLTSVLQQPGLAQWRQRYSTTGDTLFRISDSLFGGWAKANTTWFDPKSGRMMAIERAVGGPTS